MAIPCSHLLPLRRSLLFEGLKEGPDHEEHDKGKGKSR